MKIDISQKRLDEERLINEVQSFEIKCNQNAYLFMNKETLDELSSNYKPLTYFQASEYNDGIICSYCGRRVYENESLKFGEVEIR